MRIYFKGRYRKIKPRGIHFTRLRVISVDIDAKIATIEPETQDKKATEVFTYDPSAWGDISVEITLTPRQSYMWYLSTRAGQARQN